ncbi:Calreticulin family-domain-containing protein [Blyttiomyces helicus]|uniref:Calreticulin n=1 Tax=Blyttiomyces helicus TaxID=388810 RepID=A0A4P9W814_9FUNG|nr:Calreticulin family-domain-containing protein [Blyttiomyces helicus]|eukprot:RKO87563.1 Calreticulin family-domain-containing protein [Blyttiomyces helicus]
MKISTAFAALGLASTVAAEVYFKETFDDDTWSTRWAASKHRDDYGQFKVTPGKFYADEKTSRGLQTSENARFYSLIAPLDKEFQHKDKPFVLQFSVKFEQNIDCGGGYLKVVPPGVDSATFHGESPYNIMFGPDICGYDKKTHVIFSHKEKNHLIKKTIAPGSDQMTHLYTLIVNPDKTYKVEIDGEEKAAGSLAEDWDILPAKKIKDPEAKKPADWVDDATIPDPEDKKPEGYDDIPEYIADPDATKPEDWDDDMDGEWEAPKISNVEFKGEWKPKQIPNPAYKGVWIHPEIDNPEYDASEVIADYTSASLAFDLWQVKAGTIFDDIIVTDSIEEAAAFAKETYEVKKPLEKAAKDKLDEEEKAAAAAKAEEARLKAEAEAKAKEAEAAEKVEEVKSEEAEVKEHEKDEL